ncbi:hypothetical protein BDV10DRAFT_182798 [Aspergillus recurvatus]
MPFILGLLLGLISSTTADVATSNVSYTDNLVQCLPQNKSLVSMTSVSFASKYSSSPLTWTETIHLNDYPDLDSREFYFGHLPSHDRNSTSFRACSLFFYDPSLVRDESGDDLQTAFNQSREFPRACVADLTAHFDQLAGRTTLQSDEDISSFCHTQQSSVEDYHPDSCNGFILQITDTQVFTADASQPANCSLSTGQNYNLRLVTGTLMSSREQTVAGTTPVITILFPASGESSNASDSEPETHYAALQATKDLLPLTDGSGTLKASSTYLVFLSWAVGVFLAAV